MQTIWKNCGILFGKIVAFHLEELRQNQFSLIYTRLHLYRQSSHICGNFNISKITFTRCAHEEWLKRYCVFYVVIRGT